ncbi:MAG: ABC transporter ATP-binding protein, partial [Candidatus Komeilibacteria bacterium]|nr:ABC transporter ATP-binding protein [Candidatus Komeilibacteria bacterium]
MQSNYTKKTFAIFWQHLRVYRWQASLAFVAVILGSIANMYAPILYKHFFDLFGAGASVGIFVKVLIQLLIIHLVAWLFWRLANFSISWFQSRTMFDLANYCFAYLHKHSLSFFHNNFVGSLVKRVNRFTSGFEVITDIIFFELLQIAVKSSIIVVVLFLKNVWLGVLMAIWIVVFFGLNYWFSLYKLKYDVERSKVDSKVTGLLADTITNQQNIKLFNGYGRELATFREITNTHRRMRLFNWNLGNAFEAGQAFLMIVLEFIIFYVALKLWQRGLATIGDFVLLQAYLLTLFDHLWGLGRVIRRYYESLAEADEMTEILEKPHEIQDSLAAKPLVVTKGEIEFREVSFCYNQTRRIFKKFNLTIKPGERVAVVGPSGSGKTTLIAILLRHYDLESGKILIDDQKLAGVTQESIWQNISLVPQDPILFHRTLMENIRYSKPEATDEEAADAAKLAYAHDFIMNCPEQYQTYV